MLLKQEPAHWAKRTGYQNTEYRIHTANKKIKKIKILKQMEAWTDEILSTRSPSAMTMAMMTMNDDDDEDRVRFAVLM